MPIRTFGGYVSNLSRSIRKVRKLRDDAPQTNFRPWSVQGQDPLLFLFASMLDANKELGFKEHRCVGDQGSLT